MRGSFSRGTESLIIGMERTCSSSESLCSFLVDTVSKKRQRGQVVLKDKP